MSVKGKSNKFKVTFGVIVRQKRTKLNLSQEKFAEIAEVHRTYISAIELGKVDISLSTALKISSALKISLSSLIKSVESKI